jgi:phospholipase D1/2
MADEIDTHTAQIVPNTKTTVSNQYFDLNEPFAFPRYGNACTAYINGRDYMKAVATGIRSAKSFVMITGWQLDYDVELDSRGDPNHSGRISELLADALQRGVHVRVMLYDSYASKVDTHDDESQPKLNKLPAGKGSIEVILQNPNTGRSGALTQLPNLALGRSTDMNPFFSHHQKSVIIDGQVAFVGGIDLAYGRWDTDACDVVIDRALHVINDAYNGQLDAPRDLTDDEKKLTQAREGRPGFAGPYTTNGNKHGRLLDEAKQPRQPWQDVALRIEGPAAYDVFCNFVLRWNSFAGSGTNAFDSKMDSSWFERAKGPSYLVDPLKRGVGSSEVQVCRSASSAQLTDELRLWGDNYKYVNDDWKSPNPIRRKVVQAARAAWQNNHQTSIRDAMINCIRSAQAFIYIENQFFMSDCGTDQRGTACPSNNSIIAELANSIGRAIYAGRPFHVYLVLPEHPEGHLEDDGTKSQTWWALQGIKRARNSLINRINSTILAKNSKAWNLVQSPKSNEEVSLHLTAHGMLNEWRKYLTVLNVRNFGSTTSHVVTEMIYVHSKLTIVDDAVVIIGSANINDRSLNGNGDTEIAAVVVDTNGAGVTDVGGGVQCVTRSFARDLRIKLWKKHLGMLVDQPTTGVQKLGSPGAIDVLKPLSMATIQGIQKLSASNRKTYNDVFVHTPRDSFKLLTEGRLKGYTHKYRDNQGVTREEQRFTETPPLQPAFMDSNGKHKVGEALAKLKSEIKGFWVEMPLAWGEDEGSTPRAPANSPQSIARMRSANSIVQTA